MAKLILYACPVGPLAEQIETYFEQSRQLCGENSAHAYMPHCTLTGFFEDEERAISVYVEAVTGVMAAYRDRIPTPPIVIKDLIFRPRWHGFVLQADWLKQMVVDFAQNANSPTRTDALRLKDWLHLSLAYGFDTVQQKRLKALAKDSIDISAAVDWEVRLYERKPQHKWVCWYVEKLKS